jgi:hypothetical protein
MSSGPKIDISVIKEKKRKEEKMYQQLENVSLARLE